MSLNAATIEILIAKGLSASDILDVARASEVKADRTNAERQARHRAKRRNAVTVTAVTPSPNDIYSNPLPEPLDISDEISLPIVLIDEVSGEPPLTAEEILEAWNDTAGRIGLPKAKLTPQRRRKLIPLIRQHSVADFTEAIRAVERSPFLRGENGRAWRADFDFFLQSKSFTKLIEGSYDRASH